MITHLFTGKEIAAAKEYWQLILGPMLLLIVIYARGGIEGMIGGRRGG
jgi:branched-chain amino acid transport system permease protein